MRDNLTFFRTITSQVSIQATQLLQEAMKYFERGWLQGSRKGYLGCSPTHQHCGASVSPSLTSQKLL